MSLHTLCNLPFLSFVEKEQVLSNVFLVDLGALIYKHNLSTVNFFNVLEVYLSFCVVSIYSGELLGIASMLLID